MDLLVICTNGFSLCERQGIIYKTKVQVYVKEDNVIAQKGFLEGRTTVFLVLWQVTRKVVAWLRFSRSI